MTTSSTYNVPVSLPSLGDILELPTDEAYTLDMLTNVLCEARSICGPRIVGDSVEWDKNFAMEVMSVLDEAGYRITPLAVKTEEMSDGQADDVQPSKVD